MENTRYCLYENKVRHIIYYFIKAVGGFPPDGKPKTSDFLETASDSEYVLSVEMRSKFDRKVDIIKGGAAVNIL